MMHLRLTLDSSVLDYTGFHNWLINSYDELLGSEMYSIFTQKTK
jgi:hypothetical protein